MARGNARSLCFASIVLALCACGSPNTPSGSTVGSGGGPVPPPTQLVSARVTIELPIRNAARGRFRPDYLSPRTESVSIGLASVNGNGVTGVNATVIDTTAKASGCATKNASLVCTATIAASPGADVFNVIAYQWPGGTGAILAVGTIPVHMGSGGGGFQFSNSFSIDVGGVIAKMRMQLAQKTVDRGARADVPVTLEALDAAGATIVGASAYAAPVSLSIQGDTIGAFSLHDGNTSGSTIAVTRPPKTLTVSYDGNKLAASSITLQATVAAAGVSASAALAVKGTPPPLPVGSIYALNVGSGNAPGGTVTVYAGKANGNAAPQRTLTLSSSLYPRSIAVDASGKLYVGYLDNAQGFSVVNGTPDAANEIAVYAANASGSASPIAVISADPKTQSAVFPIAMSFDTAGDLVTYGATTVDRNTGDAVLVYAAGSTGSVAPAHAWAFASPNIRYAGPSGLAVDAGGNFYVDGALHTSLGPNYGVFANVAQNGSNPIVAPSRTIPFDAKTQLAPNQVSNVSLDSSGELYVGNYALHQTGSSSSCQGQINVFAAGATGGTTDVAPLRVLALSGVASNDPLCFSPTSPLVGYYPAIFAYGNSAFVADEFGNAIDAFGATASGTVKPSLSIAGSATGLNGPIAVFVAPPVHGAPVRPEPAATTQPGTAQVRFVEGSPLLETTIDGVPLPLGESFLSVNGLTIASSFDYGTMTQYVGVPSGVQSFRIVDSLGYAMGPFKTASLAGGSSYSVALAGSYPHYRVLTFAEPKPGKGATLAVYGASPALPKADFGSFKASSGRGERELGSVRLGQLAIVPLGGAVSNFGAYIGKGTAPIPNGKITPAGVDTFDTHNALPFHAVSRLSLFLFDAVGGAQTGPVFGVLDR